MEMLTVKEVVSATGGRCDGGYDQVLLNSVCIDSRKIMEGCLFFAIIGENFDGHGFIEEAIRQGAHAVVASKKVISAESFPIIYVEDTVKALGELASYYREKMGKPVIAVTGSVGKTSTKDIVGAILSTKMNVHKTAGNFNNEIGLPLTIFGLEKRHDAMVLEMGMWAEGEIRLLTKIARPSIGMITNIGLSHIEKLGTQENILKAKLEIVEGLGENGLLILNNNDPFLRQVDHRVAPRCQTIGIEVAADYVATNVKDLGEAGMAFDVVIQGRTFNIHMPAVGRHNVLNTLLGIACGLEVGLTPEEIMEGIQSYQPGKARLNILDRKGIRFIDDSYNASPDSMEAGLRVLKSFAGDKRAIAILGNMFELGHMAPEGHFRVGKVCRELGLDFVAIMGENAPDMVRGLNQEIEYQVFDSHEDIVAFMKTYLQQDDVVLVKGSRGMKMERVIELW